MRSEGVSQRGWCWHLGLVWRFCIGSQTVWELAILLHAIRGVRLGRVLRGVGGERREGR